MADPGAESPEHKPKRIETIMRFKAEAAVIVVSLLASVPFVDQAFHVDDANFLALARHATPNPLLLYDFPINWLGTEQQAFDVLSNPPLVPWYLALVSTVARGREWIFHLAFWPFIVVALLGIWRLGRRFVGPQAALWTMCWCAVAPAFVLASHTVMPDLPLLATYALGLALAIDGLDGGSSRLAVAGGLLLGLSALCRYSGMTGFALILFYAILYPTKLRDALLCLFASLMPITVWSVLSHRTYGRVHWLAMAGFQTDSFGFAQIIHHLLYYLASIGLAIVPAGLLARMLAAPTQRLTLGEWRWILLGGVPGLVYAIGARLPWSATILLVVGLSGGALVVGWASWRIAAVFRRCAGGSAFGGERDTLFLSAWLLGTVSFNLPLRFAAVRYLLPALPAAILLLQRALLLEPRSVARYLSSALAVLVLSLGLSKADADFANSYRDYVRALPPPARTRWFTGHWGLQHYLEETGAKPLSRTEGHLPQPGDEIVVPTYAWPQNLPPTLELAPLARTEIHARTRLRTFSEEGRACFYASNIAPGGAAVLLPFGISAESLEVISRFEVR